MKSIKSYLLSLILALCFIFSSCEFVPLVTPVKDPPTREEITENIQASDTSYATVSEYFVAWGFPEFSRADFAYYETPLAERFYTSENETGSIAHAVAAEFLSEKYSDIDFTDVSTVTVTLEEIYLEILFDRQSDMVASETLDETAESATDEGYTFVAQYLADWGCPMFHLSKMMRVEYLFRVYYYKDLPDTLTLAKSTETYLTENLYEEERFDEYEEATDTVIRAYVISIGDKYAVYRTAEEYDDFDSDMSGSYVGIGVTVQYTYADGKVEVTAVNESGGAKAAGIQLGDLIWAVDGVLVSDIGYQTAIKRIRGEEGTSVTVTVKRGEELLNFTIVRKQLTEETVTYQINEDGIAYVKITEFKANTGALFIAAVNALEAANVKGVIYDVRNNPGGYVSSVVTALSYLVPRGTPVISFGEYGDGYSAFDDHTYDVPSVVLCNGNTASAGELFTAALRDYTDMGLMHATTVGELTYKKGIMQSSYELYDHSMVTMTVALYYPPSGVNYDGVGVAPDEEVVKDTDTDNQLARAYEILNEKLK